MSDYRVVPVEPTTAMIHAAMDAGCVYEVDAYDIYDAIIAAAPAVQVEPVACVSEETYNSDGTSDIITKNLPIGTKLYAAPQPAEQQPELCKCQPCGCVICTCEHETQRQGCGANHCGTHPVGQFPEPAYQQPAPDVAGLVEALEMSRSDLSDWITSYPDSSHAYTANLIRHIDAVLASHRGKGGGA